MEWSGRWLSAKSKRSNLALIIAGIALVLLSPLWRFAIAPAIKVVPTDLDLLRFYDGVLVEYVRAPAQPAVGPEPSRTAITLQVREFNPIGRSTPTVSVIELESSLINSASRAHIADENTFYAVNRRTAEQVKGHGSDKDRSGYFLIFPFNTPPETLPAWDPLTGRTQNARFVRQERVGDVDTNVYQVRYSGQPAVPPAGFPTEMTGAQLKVALSAPGLPAGDSDKIKVDYKANNSYELLVEPIMGNLVATRDVESSVYMSVEDQARSLSMTRVIRKLDYSETDASQKEAAAFALNEIKKAKLQFVYLPVGFLVLGIACFLIGFFTDTRPGRGRDEPGPESGPADEPGLEPARDTIDEGAPEHEAGPAELE
jgi:hypothetical protein